MAEFKFAGGVEFDAQPGNPSSGVTLEQATALTGAEGIIDEVLAALEPPIDPLLLLENALI